MQTSHWIYPLAIQRFGNTTKILQLIPHRAKTKQEKFHLIKKVENNFVNNVRQRGVTITNNNLQADTLMLSEVIELILKSIKQSDYVYNHECFLGIDFQHNDSHTNHYDLDEVPFSKNTKETLSYYENLVDIYNPLLVLNPFASNDAYGYKQLSHQFEEKLFIGVGHGMQINSSLEIAALNVKTDIKETEKNILTAHKNNHKYLMISDDNVPQEKIKKVIEKVQPDFIQTKHFL